ncbi:ShlB/FhaC/HecB family hemolysin secretion/activation protein [Paracoccus denitrificans]|uniref:Polypeptide-transport-associated domain protein, ShlB-type n=1 Tax=Paracoccus denitrificans (strain Pd 1222) TaxID=318586 RepID=A1B4V3_PARDP|nr:ShlB/FhaC/HecB family hemolysin secretion/activation protein [Paracoccus denitrificans]ABL70547.1 Polypeptide-transport-associated domain protein, ShlB-type [Paracoccus denitrificans PD1222]MBB4627431.1 hemolysin activation/secretion protein [Paracoccus denitrificans]MCU7429400.1 ShlB/FhaC/HecB family hemolysin secretion/activation protein [Paracoccus denitrificans]QAR25882.1 ShlB/FhaC/HecB family hemolysin secretion/activation protein [Paracoccus denitrificans]UPV94788.1 ShlB/FhaC/HecB fam
MTLARRGIRLPRPTAPAALITALAALALLALPTGPARTQTAGQITQDSYQPPMQRLSGSVVFSGSPGLAAPPGADRLSIRLADVRVEGALPGSEAEVAALRQRLTGKRIAVSEIFAAASDLEAAYVRNGYVLSRVVIPAQTLEDGGALRLTVVSGFVERIDSSAAPPGLRARLDAMTAPLVDRPTLRLPDIERRLLLAGDMFGVALGSALSTGARPGGTIIILNPQFRSVTGFVGLDNSFSRELGRWNLSAGVELNNQLGRGEVFYLRASGHPRLGDDGYFSDRPQLRTLAGGAVLPLGHDGLTFGIEAASSRTGPDTGAVATASDFDRLSFRLFYPVVRSVKRNISVTAALDLQRDRQDLETGAGDFGLYKDRTRVLRLTGEGNWQLSDQSALRMAAVLSLGLDALGARSAAEATPALPLSRDGADADFRKLELSFRYDRDFRQDWSLALSGQAQSAFGDPLLSSEQFGIASTEGLSAFDLGSLSGDSGWFLRGEVARHFPTQGFGRPLVVSPYVFAAVGAVNLENPSADEAARIKATSFGIGVDLRLIRDPSYSSALIRFEYGKGNRDDGQEDPSRFTIVSSYRF